MSSWHSYSKIYNMGHAAVADLLRDPIVVQEKIDGSQFSFGVLGKEGEKVLRARSHHREINMEAPDRMFEKAINSIKELEPNLTIGWTYRGEYCRAPKANTLVYDRVPKMNIVVFDINIDEEKYLSPSEVKKECDRLGLETVPTFFEGKIEDIEQFKKLLDTVSFLGGQKIEGIVIKNYSRFDEKTGKAMMGKFVSEKFREMNSKDWKKRNPSQGGVLEALIAEIKTEARFDKAYQHLLEKGEITNELKDIGSLMRELSTDTKEEVEEHIKAKLFKWAWPQISRAVSKGLPEWYKHKLLEKQFVKNSQ